MKESKFELKHFENNEFGQLDIFEINEHIWFVGKQVCKMFNDTNSKRSLSRLDNSDKIKHPVKDSMGRVQQTTLINESGLYVLLFNMQPQKANKNGGTDAYLIKKRIEKLTKFKRWVTSEVLPSIRKHGVYIEDEVIQKLKDNPNYINELEEKLKQSKEVFDYYNIVHNNTDTQSMADFAKLIQEETGLGRNKLMQKLREKKILRRNNTPYQGYMKYFKVVQIVGHDGKIVSVTRVKNSKQDSLIKLITKDYKKVA